VGACGGAGPPPGASYFTFGSTTRRLDLSVSSDPRRAPHEYTARDRFRLRPCVRKSDGAVASFGGWGQNTLVHAGWRSIASAMPRLDGT
jgi:hypothetical protein